MLKILIAGKNIPTGLSEGLKRLGLETEFITENDRFPDLELFSAVYFSGEFPTASEKCRYMAKELCRRCADFSIPVVFDPDLADISADKYDIINEVASSGVVFVPSIEEAVALCGRQQPEDVAKYYLEMGAAKIVVTLDKKGAFYKSAKESGYAPTFQADKVVDTSGAGSAFAAGLISGITEEIPLSEAVVRANACGCIAIQAEGELDCLPTMEQLREYMLSHRFVVDECKYY